MGSLFEHNPSLWAATTADAAPFAPLAGDRTVDVVVIGAGITGLSAAALLAGEGCSVAVVEAGSVAAGATGYTTAKVTSLHGLIYATVSRTLGDEHARAYGEANEAAIGRMERFVDEGGIDCDWERRPAYSYTEEEGQVGTVRTEADCALRLGLPASFTATTDLPFPVRAAVRFDDQAQFHPRKYCLGLARLVVSAGGQIFERTRALDVDDDGRVATATGTLTAGSVIVASHLPFLDRSGHFARCAPYRSYAIAIPAQPALTGMYLSVDGTTRSVRLAGGLCIIGGEGHKTGHDDDTEARYGALVEWAGARFGTKEVAYRWSAQDYATADGLPYIGRLTPGSERLLVATGYGKWGMTNGTVAAMILADTIAGRDNPWAATFDSTRVKPLASARSLAEENLDVAKAFVGDRLGNLRRGAAEDLQPGEGAVVKVDGRTVAAYRDDDGQLQQCSAKCPHLGCQVRFNSAERTWDCPCHGSRFGTDGAVLAGPALKGLDRLS